MLAGPANVGVRDDLAGKRLPLLPPDATPEQVGYGKIADLPAAPRLARRMHEVRQVPRRLPRERRRAIRSRRAT